MCVCVCGCVGSNGINSGVLQSREGRSNREESTESCSLGKGSSVSRYADDSGLVHCHYHLDVTFVIFVFFPLNCSEVIESKYKQTHMHCYYVCPGMF